MTLHVGYSVYWGMLEPLGRSVLAPELELLSREVRLTVVTWEKPEDVARPGALEAERERWDALGVRWIPLRYRKRPPVLSSLLDARSGIRALRRVHEDDPFDLLFGRALVGGVAAVRTAERIGRPLVFHSEGSWVDEQVDAGAWREGSLPHRAARGLEAEVLRGADGVAVLTAETIDAFRSAGRIGPDTPTIVVPNTSVLADRAEPGWLREGGAPEGGWTVAYLGSIGGRYLLDEMLDFCAHLEGEGRLGTLLVLAPREHERIRAAVERAGLSHRLELDAVPFEEVPARLSRAHLGLFFLADGIAAGFVSATKVAEYLACGLAVVTTAWSGDAGRRVLEADAGVALTELGPAGWRAATAALDRLVADPELPARAQRYAKANYGARSGVDRQLELMHRITGGDR